MSRSDPRVLIISERATRPAVQMSYYYEHEDVVCSIDSVDLLVPEHKPVRRGSATQRWVDRLNRHTGWRLSRANGVQPVQLQHNYDILFVIGPFLRHDMPALHAVRDWQRRCRVKVADIHELWVNQFAEQSEWAKRQWNEFDHIFVGFPGSVEAAETYFGRECHCLPGGVDALKFCPPLDNQPDRTIDVMNFGRRNNDVHDALIEWAERTGRWYEYDTMGAGEMRSHVRHRRRLAGMIQRTKYFISHQAQFNNPEKRGKQEEIGIRHFEGAACGAVLVGDPPRSPSTSELFGWEDAIVPVASDSNVVIDIIEQLEREPERVERIRRANIRHCLLQHDWAYRWKHVLETIGFDLTDAHQARLAELERLAAKFTN